MNFLKINKSLIFFLIFFIIFSVTSRADYIIGPSEIIDGDTIKINSKKIRLFGIDAPEKNQICKKPYASFFIFSLNKNYFCGKYSTLNLKKFLKKNEIKCKIKGIDRYKRYLAICFKNSQDINSWLVKNGYAVAYRKYSLKYINEENYSKKNKIGIWRGYFEMPWNWRKNN